MQLLEKFLKPLPRYTSYPTAATFAKISLDDYFQALQSCDSTISLYIHIPFCKKLCLFCGCTTFAYKNEALLNRYVDAVIGEIQALKEHTREKKKLLQLYLGGGTPAILSNVSFEKLFSILISEFDFDDAREFSIEFDPRDDVQKIAFLRKLGFNRISFGVQDTNEEVQRAIGRHMHFSSIQEAINVAKKEHFDEINIDLVYGLPSQNQKSFEKTLNQVLKLDVDRLSLFSWAYIPHLKPMQKIISPELFPSAEEKFALYTMAKKFFQANGYVAIGMDHFAKANSASERALKQKTLTRNFQGYSTKVSDTLIGVGLSAISSFRQGFFQNEKNLERYLEGVESKECAILLGKLLSEDDKKRAHVISELMCFFACDKKRFSTLFNCDFDRTFEGELKLLREYERENLVEEDESTICATEAGKLYIRNIASIFDRYLAKEQKAIFSSSI